MYRAWLRARYQSIEMRSIRRWMTVGNLDVGDLAHLLAEESLGDGGVDGNLALAQIGLTLAHDGIGHLSLVGHVGHFDLAHNLYSVGAETRHIYYLGLGDG